MGVFFADTGDGSFAERRQAFASSSSGASTAAERARAAAQAKMAAATEDSRENESQTKSLLCLT